MQRSIVGTLIALTTSVLCGATEARAEELQLGVKGGINFFDVTRVGDGTDDIEVRSEPGWMAGATLTIPVGRRLAIQPEVYYSARRFTLSEIVDVKIRANAIEAPVLLRYSLGDGARATPYLLAGPRVAFETGVEQELLGITEDVSDDVRDTDFSLVFGAGVGLPVGDSFLDLEVRYALGLKKLDQEDVVDAQSRALVVALGLRF